MSLQQNALLREQGGSFEVGSIERPAPAAQELLVKIHTTALNPVDWKRPKLGLYKEHFPLEYPAVLGLDGAGVVEAVGDGVTSIKPGQRVMFQGHFCNSMSTYQEYAVVPADIAAVVPPNISFDEAAAIPVALFTAAIGLYAPTPAGAALPAPWEPGYDPKTYTAQSMLILGGSSSVGALAIQWARLSGFGTIVTTASLRHEAHLKSLGATYVVDRTSSDVSARLSRALLSPPSIVYDAISTEDTQALGFKALAPGGTMVITLDAAPGVEDGKEVKTVVQVMGSAHVQRELGASLCASLPRLLEAGEIKPINVEVLPDGLNGIPGWLDRLEKGEVSGVKLVARPAGTPAV